MKHLNFFVLFFQKSIGDVRPQSRNPDNYYTVKTRTKTFMSSFIPFSVKLWNSLNACDRTLTYLDCLMKKPKPLLLYHSSRKSSVKHAQLRMRCSKLNFDLFSLHVIHSPACPCGHIREDSNHYLLQCPLYVQARNKMLNDIRQLCTLHISGDLLLYGAVELDYATNCKLFDVVHDYIEKNWQTVIPYHLLLQVLVKYRL